MVQITPRYIKSLRTRAERARTNAAVLREAAAKPETAAMKVQLLEGADQYEARAKAAEERIRRCSVQGGSSASERRKAHISKYQELRAGNSSSFQQIPYEILR
jgi:D-serine deaminase-like pyridoxal phosphate-dependent protein